MDEMFAEFWNTIKEYVPAKERQTAADHSISILIDAGASDDILYALKGCDKNMAQAEQINQVKMKKKKSMMTTTTDMMTTNELVW